MVPAKSSHRTTFWTTLLFCDEMGSVLLSKDATKSPCPLQVVLSDRAFSIVKLAVRFHKDLASYAYERLAKKRLDEERDC